MISLLAVSAQLKPQRGRCPADCREALPAARPIIYWQGLPGEKDSKNKLYQLPGGDLGAVDPAPTLEREQLAF